jgi:hypothetical protein
VHDCRPTAGRLHCEILINLEEYSLDCIRRMTEEDIDYLQISANPVHPTTMDDKNRNDGNGLTGANL